MSGGRNSIRSGVLTEDDGRGSDIPGTVEGAGRVRGMQEEDGGRVAGIPPDDTERTGEGRAVELGRLIHGRRPAKVSAGLPDQGRAEELPCGGLRRKGWYMDSNADAFLQLACPGHCDHIGGGKPPTPKVLMMRHSGPVEDNQR